MPAEVKPSLMAAAKAAVAAAAATTSSTTSTLPTVTSTTNSSGADWMRASVPKFGEGPTGTSIPAKSTTPSTTTTTTTTSTTATAAVTTTTIGNDGPPNDGFVRIPSTNYSSVSGVPIGPSASQAAADNKKNDLDETEEQNIAATKIQRMFRAKTATKAERVIIIYTLTPHRFSRCKHPHLDWKR
jgi:molecular chaperone DnaK (HSP70)